MHSIEVKEFLRVNLDACIDLREDWIGLRLCENKII
jgi:hypothetical protein